MPSRSADLDFALGAQRNLCSASTPFSDENGHLLENEDESGRRFCEYWGTIFEARVEGQRHHLCENILRYDQKAPDDIRWVIDKSGFDELIATKKESAPGPAGIPHSFSRCAGGEREGLGSRVLFCAYKHVLEWYHHSCAFCRIPKSSDVDNNGRIVRSLEALRKLTLCKCDCKILTTAICQGRHWYTMRCIHILLRDVSLPGK